MTDGACKDDECGSSIWDFRISTVIIRVSKNPALGRKTCHNDVATIS